MRTTVFKIGSSQCESNEIAGRLKTRTLEQYSPFLPTQDVTLMGNYHSKSKPARCDWEAPAQFVQLQEPPGIVLITPK